MRRANLRADIGIARRCAPRILFEFPAPGSGVNPPLLTLHSRHMITSAIPVVAVSDSTRAEDYYCRVLGFVKMAAYPPDATAPDPRYVAVARDGVWIHLQSYKPERAGHTDAFLWV